MILWSRSNTRAKDLHTDRDESEQEKSNLSTSKKNERKTLQKLCWGRMAKQLRLMTLIATAAVSISGIMFQHAALNGYTRASFHELLSTFSNHLVATKSENLRSRKVILLGPHDRYNFGDLLFTKVILRLLQTRAGYDVNDILFGGIISANMTRYGEKLFVNHEGRPPV